MRLPPATSGAAGCSPPGAIFRAMSRLNAGRGIDSVPPLAVATKPAVRPPAPYGVQTSTWYVPSTKPPSAIVSPITVRPARSPGREPVPYSLSASRTQTNPREPLSWPKASRAGPAVIEVSTRWRAAQSSPVR